MHKLNLDMPTCGDYFLVTANHRFRLSTAALCIVLFMALIVTSWRLLLLLMTG